MTVPQMDEQRVGGGARRRRQRIVVLSVIVAVLSAITVVVLVAGRKDAVVPRSNVLIGTVERGPMLLSVRGTGNLVPRHTRWLTAETDVRVERIVVFPGTRVKADTVILELHNGRVQDDYLAAEMQYQAAVLDHRVKQTELRVQSLQARAELGKVESELAAARAQEKIERMALDKDVIPRIQYQKTEIDLAQLISRQQVEKARVAEIDANAQASLQSDTLRVSQLKNTMDLRRREVDALRVRAGVEGVVQRVLVEEGQQVPEGTKVALVSRPEELEAELRIPETEARDLQPGQAALVDTRNGKMAGTLSRIDPEVVDGTVKVRIAFSDTLVPGARPDLSVDGTITLGRLADVLFVRTPVNAQRDSQARLFKVQGDIAQRVPVTIGHESSRFVEIKGGLKQGDRVILSDMSAYDDQSRLRLD
ncbi:HlyD family efflux transporter periplasmic adaptor subunit [Xanthomonas cassavae CFBP 4642]|uniref:HlyD family efflux transporter periplasmic adaptor subunit n=1 Tax=Xanthomonas cassavae CFBP 4642 TaxID=1219375 RepID=A0ABS8HKW3_9XANT|nr:HlyD family efflux transporter periplasmic adaptor subunit [Xanthomonas cassavae]MCC4622329.1 HlyD family efflux transporter periplasmic adaptor subunit [Xanthomonas cassavae CFBP 4642]